MGETVGSRHRILLEKGKGKIEKGYECNGSAGGNTKNKKSDPIPPKKKPKSFKNTKSNDTPDFFCVEALFGCSLLFLSQTEKKRNSMLI